MNVMYICHSLISAHDDNKVGSYIIYKRLLLSYLNNIRYNCRDFIFFSVFDLSPAYHPPTYQHQHDRSWSDTIYVVLLLLLLLLPRLTEDDRL